MSTKPIGTGDGGVPQKSGETQVEISYAKKNASGDWEAAELTSEKMEQLNERVATIRRIALGAAGTALGEVLRPNSVSRITSEGVWVEHGDKWELIQNDRTVGGTTKKIILKQTADLGDIQIEVRVVPQELVPIEKGLRQELVFQKNLKDAAAALKEVDVTALKIPGASARLEYLGEIQVRIVKTMQDVQALLRTGKKEQALSLYAKKMPYNHGLYCDAMREWQKDQKVLQNNGWSLPIDVAHHVQGEVVEGLIQIARNDRLEQELTVVADQITFAHANYQRALDLAKFAEEQVTTAYNGEKTYNGAIDKALAAFESDLPEQLLKAGWTEGEIAAHRDALRELKKASDATLNVLKTTRAWLSAGSVQNGMDYYSRNLLQLGPQYLEATQKLVIPQQLTTLRKSGAQVVLDLKRPQTLVTTLQTITSQSKLSPVVDVAHKPVFNETAWEGALEAMGSASGKLNDAIKFARMTVALNVEHKAAQEYTKKIGAFAQAYHGQRELFESIMREAGVSDLESAFIFNHYPDLYEALASWDQGMQRVVDLANQGKYQEALAAYTDLVDNQYPNLLEKARKGFLSTTALNRPEVKSAVRSFAEQVKLPNSWDVATSLDTSRVATKPGMVFKESAEGVEDASGSPKMSIRKSRLLMTTALTAVNQEWLPEAMDLTTPISLPVKDPLSIPLQSYSQLIEPLLHAQQAISAESDPQKKRALTSQLRELARTCMPEINRLHVQLRAASAEIERKGATKNVVKQMTFVNDLYTNLGLAVSEDLTAQRLSILVQDKAFLEVLKEQGLERRYAERLGDWYDDYRNQAVPLLQAKKALEADPENVELQRAYKQVAIKQVPILDRLASEFRKMGGDETS